MSIIHFCKHGTVEHPIRPAQDHHIVVTTVDEKRRFAMHPICDFDRAIAVAITLANLKRDQPVSVKLRCWHFRDLCWSLGIDPKSLNISREEVVATLKSALLRSQEPAVRREAFDELIAMGVIR
jgi:hypothetical protein